MADSDRTPAEGPPPPRQHAHQPQSQPLPHPQYHSHRQSPSHPYPQSQPQPHGHPQPPQQHLPRLPTQHPPAVKHGVLALQQHHPNQASPSPPIPHPKAPSSQGRSAASSPVGVIPGPGNRNMAAPSPLQSPARNIPGSSPSPVPPMDFKSPVLRASPLDDGYERELHELKRVMCQSRPVVVRQAVRDLFETTLKGSDYHSSFICHVMFHTTPPAVFAKATKELGRNLVKSSIAEIFTHVDTEDLESRASQLLPKAGTGFLDQALAIRLESIPGRQLVNALAKSERLGYSVEDIVVESSDPSRAERVIPSMNQVSRMIASQPSQPSATAAMPSTDWPVSAETIKRLGILFCSTCGRPCSGKRALAAHARNRACNHAHASFSRLNKDICIHCGQSFTSNGGCTYHIRSHVCGDYTFDVEKSVRELLKAAQSTQPTQPAQNATIKQPRSMEQKHNNGVPRSTPGHGSSSTTVTNSSATPTPAPGSGGGLPDNSPYAKLTPDQRQKFDAEMKRAEENYGRLVATAMDNPDKEAQATELARLKNSYNTKQSLTRKKYGIRLRERRTKAEVEEERLQLMAKGDVANKRARADSGTQNTPSKRIMISEMGGGLSAAAGTAELHDPTTSRASTASTGMLQPQWQPGPSQPAQTSVHQTSVHQTSVHQPTAPLPGSGSVTPNHPGTVGDPMQIGDSSDDDTSDSETDDNESAESEHG